MTHERVLELLPAFALDALSPDEERAVLAHLPGCAICQRELAELRHVTDQLATGVQPAIPSPELGARVLEVVRPRPAVITLPRVWASGLAATAAVVVLLLALVTISLNQRVVALQTRLAAQEQVLALLAAPSAKSATLTGSVTARVRFLYDPVQQQGALVVSDLRDPGKEFVYQLWLIAGNQPQSAGIFRPVPGRPIIVPVAADFRRYQAVAISVERAPAGAPQPTTTPILVATI